MTSWHGALRRLKGWVGQQSSCGTNWADWSAMGSSRDRHSRRRFIEVSSTTTNRLAFDIMMQRDDSKECTPESQAAPGRPAVFLLTLDARVRPAPGEITS